MQGVTPIHAHTVLNAVCYTMHALSPTCGGSEGREEWVGGCWRGCTGAILVNHETVLLHDFGECLYCMSYTIETKHSYATSTM